MSADDDSHNLDIQHKEPDNLPWKKFSPEFCWTGWSWRVIYLFRAAGNGVIVHKLGFDVFGYSGIKNQKGFAFALYKNR